MIANDKKSFVLYNNYENQLKLLSMEERGQLITAIFEYSNCQTVTVELSPIVNMAFSFIKEALDRDRESYVEKCQKNTENGKKGGRPKKNISMSKTERFFEKPKKADNDSDNDNDNGNENDIDNDIDSGNGIEGVYPYAQGGEVPAPEASRFDDRSFTVSDTRSTVSDLFPSFSDTYPSVSDGPRAPRLSEQEKEELIKKGLPRSYISEREARASAYAQSRGADVASVLLRWWGEDLRARPQIAAQRDSKEQRSYDTDEFFAAALARSERLFLEEGL